MFCAVAQRKFSELSAVLDEAAVGRRLPYMGTIELTYRCNQSCRHCYCNLGVNDRRMPDEMTTREVFRVLDEAADAGCLWLLLTGGEVLLREDFWDIYTHAVRRGMLVEVFTNATLLDEAGAAKFAALPPLGIDISIYGSCASVHDSVTRLEGSFDRTVAAMKSLKRYNVRFSLKTILMTLNYHDLTGMRRLAGELGAEFRYDTLVCPRIDGDMSPARYRLSADVMAELDIRDDYDSCERIFAGFWDKKPNEALMCGAGVFAFNINPYGVLSPCTMFRSFQYPLAGRNFAQGWKALVSDYDERSADFTAEECRSCSMLLICSNCPAWAEMEVRAMNRKVDYICAYTRCLEKRFFREKEDCIHGKKAVSKTADPGSEADD
ncbi:MAG TPA: radical SAM protein [Candidatus Omnitrophota bacterium]|nr:radical SAM protein [Candidatus Omnitrophota bacterium]